MLWLTKESLPRNVVTANGDSYKIHSDFRTWIKVDCILRDEDIPDESKMPAVANIVGISLFEFLKDPDGISQALFDFYLCGKKFRDVEAKTNGKRSYDFFYDCDLLYASFQKQYRINILTANLHWYEFKALFDSLDEDTVMAKAIMYRTQDTSELKGKELEYAQKLERYWRLPEEHATREKTPEELEAEVLARCYGREQ